ncbi:PREDICTED: SLAM family member 8-like [Gekko japonicus]|uniref:SLAM family member 8-like n=1 Tax=Gekko japonicus TaxID=146911 RepID=A0ABM1LGG3_GEKJA|nr:PREDICTED: SLAM family member 8-like [Gekko japonicus]
MLRRLLLLLLGTLLLSVCLDGTSGIPVPDERQVNGTVGGSVLLTALIPPGKAVAEIEWNFQLQDDTVLVIAEFTKGNFGRPDPGDRFQQRLERANETTLRLKNLVKEDSGVYTAHVTFESGEAPTQTFRLVVSGTSKAIEQWNLLVCLFIIAMPFLT